MPEPEQLTPAQQRFRLILAGLYLSVIAGVGICWAVPALKSARAGNAMSHIADLQSALGRYYAKHDRYPAGDGSGTRELLNKLAEKDAQGLPFFQINDEFLQDGHLRNPIDTSKRFYYRCPGLHNPKSFDLWCEDANGHADGINNWDK